ncbi:AbrB/MazE/SpoVT family DNA-binding domain-containing protein [Pseudomonas sp. LB3P58]
MPSVQVIIEEWDGDGAIRLPDAALQELGLDVGDSLYIVEADPVTQTLVLSKTPKLRDRLDDLVDQVTRGAVEGGKG